MFKLDLILQVMNQTRRYQKEKSRKVIGLVKDELGGIIKIKYLGLRAKTYSYLTDDGSKDKKAKGTKPYFIKKTTQI